MKPTFTGQWSEVQMELMRIQAQNVSTFREEMQALGEQIKTSALDHIRKHDLGWPALKPGTIAKKGHATFFIETGDYIASIKINVSMQGDSLELLVGPTGTHEPSGLDMQDLGSYIEYGTTRLPPRPLWRKVYAEVPKMVRKELAPKLLGRLAAT